MGGKRKVIGYLGHILPILSETFVVREIVALRDLGAEVKAFSVHRPDKTAIHPEAPGLAEEVGILARPLNPLFWLAHLFFAVRHPIRYFRCLWRYVLTSGEPPRRRLRCLTQFAVAPFAALLMHRAGVEHLHAHFANTPAGVAMMTAGLAAIPFSFTAHAHDIFVDNLLLPAKLESAAFVATISRFNRRYLRDRYTEAENAKIEIVRCGVDTSALSPQPHAAHEPPVVLAVGRLVDFKGFETLIEACARLKDGSTEILCYIAGDGPERGRLERTREDLGLSDRVRLLGRMLPTDLLEYYRRADLMVAPSCERDGFADGIPVVLMEAMAMEIPVVSTRVSGIPELVRDGETGLLVEPDDPQGLAEAIAHLLSDRALARRLAVAGRELVDAEFNIRRSAERMHELLVATERKPTEGATS